MDNQFFAESHAYIEPGTRACAGCPMELVLRIALPIIGPKVIVVFPPGCGPILGALNQETCMRVPWMVGNLPACAAYGTGLRAGLRAKGMDDVTVLTYCGDGATSDIGFASLSGAAERGEKIFYLCYDNEAYMNTGIQASGSTMVGSRTTTTPAGKSRMPKDIPRLMIDHGLKYVATASVAYPKDFARKVKRALEEPEFVYIHVHTPCPPGWGFPASKTIELARLAVETGLWAVYEAINGEITVNIKPRQIKPVEEYLKLQRRFRDTDPETLKKIQQKADENVARYLK